MSEQTPADSASPVERLVAALTGSEDGQPEATTDSQPPEGDEPEGTAAVVEDEGEADTPASDEAENGQAEDAEGEAESEEGDDGADAGEPAHIEIDGEQVPLEEAKLGYLRQADYTRKTQAVAEQRKQAEEERQYYASALNSVLSAVGADVQRFQSVDWERAAAENPEQYAQAKVAYENSLRLFNGVKSQTEDFVNRTRQAQQAALEAQAKESIAVLKTQIPGWSNDVYSKIGDYAINQLGFKPEEFNNMADHRAIMSIWKSMQYDQGRNVATSKALGKSPKRTLTDKQAALSTNAKNRVSVEKQRDRLKETGKLDDAIGLLVNRMR